MVYDAHVHFGNGEKIRNIIKTSVFYDEFPCYQGAQPDKIDNYDKLLKQNGLAGATLMPFVFKENVPKEENAELLQFCESNEGFYPFLLLDEKDVNAAEQHKNQIYGVKEHFIQTESVLTNEKAQIFDIVNKYGITFVIHSTGAQRIEYVSSILKLFPHIKIQIAHMGRGSINQLDFIFEVMAAFKGYDNVFYDTSTIRDCRILEKSVNLIGPERILYGSDFPFSMENTEEDIIEKQISHVLKSKISDDAKERILGGNFKNLIAKRDV